ncbi:PadR family transcriptional regulator [uncultured Microbacterium sp.]|uniref:PadR family transcriptional regulator n=1 Tax=uncultured Microbacterium sp. TaxID=191216 RepID=UPI002605BBBF|nr:PadR family transcriptional regulator [uncultured Microbacterium sp.]
MTADAVKLTPLGAMVLALLAEGDMHPYEMIRLLRHRQDDRIVRVTNGTFYHTVARLERDGLIAEAGVDREGNRPERTTYTLQPAARPALQDWVRAGLGTSDRTAEFRVALAESHNLRRADVIELLSARLAALQAEHDSLHGKLTAARARGVLDQFLIEADRHVALLSAELTWTAGVLERLSDPDFAWLGDAASTASASS